MAKKNTRRVVTETPQPFWRAVCRKEYMGHTIVAFEYFRHSFDHTLNRPVRIELDGQIYTGYIGGTALAPVTSPACAISHVQCALYQQHLAASKKEVA